MASNSLEDLLKLKFELLRAGVSRQVQEESLEASEESWSKTKREHNRTLKHSEEQDAKDNKSEK